MFVLRNKKTKMEKGHQLSGEPSSINFFEPSKRHNVNIDILPNTNNLPYFTIIKKKLYKIFTNSIPFKLNMSVLISVCLNFM